MKTITVTVSIQMDIKKDGEQLEQVQEVLDLINTIVGASELESQPQVLVSSVDNSDITESTSELEEEEKSEPEIKLRSVEGGKCFHVPESYTEKLSTLNLIHYDGTEWRYFDEEWELLSAEIKKMC